MKNVTFKEYCDIKGYGKGKSVNISQLASQIGLSVAYISKLYNGANVSTQNSLGFQKVANFVAKDGYNLVSASMRDYYTNNHIKENKELKTKIACLEQENKMLKEQLEYYNNLLIICNKISNNQYNIDNIALHIKKRLK